MSTQLRRDTTAGIVCGILVAVIYSVSRLRHEPLPASMAAALSPAVAAIVIGFALARASRRQPWTWPALGTAAALGAIAGVAAGLAQHLEPALSTIEATGLPVIVRALPLMPAVLSAAVVGTPGALSVGLLSGKLLELATLDRVTGGGVDFPLLALLQLPLIAAPAELWLISRGSDRGPVTLSLAGAAVGFGSYVSARLFAPASFAATDWLGIFLGALLHGAILGWIVARVRDRAIPSSIPD